jgi:hypothetical protein
MDLDQCYDKFEDLDILSDYTDDESKFSHNWRLWVRENHPDRKLNIKDPKIKERITQKFQVMSDCKDKIYNDLYKNRDKSVTNTFENLMDEIDQSEMSDDEKRSNGIELLYMLYNYSNSLLEHTIDPNDYIMIQTVNAIILGIILVIKNFFKLGSGQVGGEGEDEDEDEDKGKGEGDVLQIGLSNIFSSMKISTSSPTMIPAGMIELQMKQLEMMEKMIEVEHKRRLYDIDIRKEESRLAAQDIVKDILITERNENRFQAGIQYITMILGLLMSPFFAYQVYNLVDLTIIDIARILNDGAINMHLKLEDTYVKSNFVTQFILDKTLGLSNIATMTSSRFLEISKRLQITITGLIFFIFLAIYMIFLSGSGIKGREKVRETFGLYNKKNKIQDKPQNGGKSKNKKSKNKKSNKKVYSKRRKSPKRRKSGSKK